MPKELQEKLDYIERKFREEGLVVVHKSWDENDEAYEVETEDSTYTCEVGSDDDELVFTDDYDNEVTMPIPEDWE